MIRLRTIHEPATTLTRATQSSLLDDIVALNLQLSESESFQRNWTERSASFMANTDTLVLAYEGGQLVGHYSSKQVQVGELELTYVDTFTTHPRLQRSGLGSRLALSMTWNGLVRSRGASFMLASRTMAPNLAGKIRESFGDDNYYPSFRPGQPPPAQLAAVAEGLARQMWPEQRFFVETGVLEGAYGGRFLVKQTSHRSVVQAHFDRHVDVDRGDAIVQVIWYRRQTLAPFLRRLPGLVTPSMCRQARARDRAYT